MEEKIFYNSMNNKLCGIIKSANNNKVVIMCHGIRSNKEECGSFSYLAKRLNEEGYSSFRFDFNGHGESSGNDLDFSISSAIIDLKNTIKMLKEKGYSEFILLGASFGASIVSIFPFQDYNCIKGIILWFGALNHNCIKIGNLFSDENKKIAEENGFYISKSINTGKEFKFGLELFNEVDEYKPYEYLKKLNLPKLFVHGKADSVVPYKISEEVSKMCNSSKLELIENGEHSFKNSKDALENAVDVTVKFVKEVLK